MSSPTRTNDVALTTRHMQFWHLSPDHLLKPVPKLQGAAEQRFGPQKDYGEMYTGDQVRR